MELQKLQKYCENVHIVTLVRDITFNDLTIFIYWGRPITPNTPTNIDNNRLSDITYLYEAIINLVNKSYYKDYDYYKNFVNTYESETTKEYFIEKTLEPVIFICSLFKNETNFPDIDIDNDIDFCEHLRKKKLEDNTMSDSNKQQIINNPTGLLKLFHKEEISRLMQQFKLEIKTPEIDAFFDLFNSKKGGKYFFEPEDPIQDKCYDFWKLVQFKINEQMDKYKINREEAYKKIRSRFNPYEIILLEECKRKYVSKKLLHSYDAEDLDDNDFVLGHIGIIAGSDEYEKEMDEELKKFKFKPTFKSSTSQNSDGMAPERRQRPTTLSEGAAQYKQNEAVYAARRASRLALGRNLDEHPEMLSRSEIDNVLGFSDDEIKKQQEAFIQASRRGRDRNLDFGLEFSDKELKEQRKQMFDLECKKELKLIEKEEEEIAKFIELSKANIIKDKIRILIELFNLIKDTENISKLENLDIINNNKKLEILLTIHDKYKVNGELNKLGECVYNHFSENHKIKSDERSTGLDYNPHRRYNPDHPDPHHRRHHPDPHHRSHHPDPHRRPHPRPPSPPGEEWNDTHTPGIQRRGLTCYVDALVQSLNAMNFRNSIIDRISSCTTPNLLLNSFVTILERLNTPSSVPTINIHPFLDKVQELEQIEFVEPYDKFNPVKPRTKRSVKTFSTSKEGEPFELLDKIIEIINECNKDLPPICNTERCYIKLFNEGLIDVDKQFEEELASAGPLSKPDLEVGHALAIQQPFLIISTAVYVPEEDQEDEPVPRMRGRKGIITMNDQKITIKGITYLLKAIIVHAGGLDGGHYYAITREGRFNDNWVKYSSSIIQNASVTGMDQGNECAYYLFEKETHNGGSINNKYFHKYLKYKNKYLELSKLKQKKLGRK